MKTTSYILLILFYCVTQTALGQDWKTLDSDDLFLRAREEAFDGNREESRKMLRYILGKSPGYEDVRILLARTYAWDGEREMARKELKKVLNNNSNSQDGLNALIDTEMWDEKYEAALVVVGGALNSYPVFEDFLYKKASILNELKKYNDAKTTLTLLLNINPAHQKGLDLLQSIELSRRVYTIGATYSFDAFSRTFNPAHYGSIQLSRQNAWGSGIFRLNYANRFNTSGLQPEIDLYPRIANGVYAYLNYGYSTSSIFPTNRVGAELFSKLPKSMEISGGIRYLNFSSTSNVLIYTGALGIYFKSYWLSLRPYITPDEKLGTSYSTTLSIRKYWQDPENYFGFNVGAGFSPDEKRFQSGRGFTGDNIYTLKSQRAGITWQHRWNTTILNASIGVTRQELIFDQGNFVLITNTSISIQRKF